MPKLIPPSEPINFEPTILQHEMFQALEDPSKTIVFMGGAGGTGKSFGGCSWITIQCMRYPGTMWGMTRARLVSLKRSTLITLKQVFKHFNLKEDVNYTHDHSLNVITFWNTSCIMLFDCYLLPSDSEFERLSSIEFTGVLIDEVSEVSFKAFNVIQSRIRFLHQKYNLSPKLLICSNPTQSYIKGMIYEPYINGTLPENISCIVGTSETNKYIDQSYRDNLNRLDPVTKARLLGDWDYNNSDDSIFDQEHLVNCFYNHNFINTDTTKYMSVDVANMGNDNTCIVLWSGLDAYEIQLYKHKNTPQIIEIIKSLMITHGVKVQNLIIDVVGVGVGVGDSFPNSIRHMSNHVPKNPVYKTIKDEMYYTFAKLVNEDKIRISYNGYRDEICEELAAHRLYNIDKEQKSQVTSKEVVKQQLGRSPDIADALTMRMYWIGNTNKVEFKFF
jgi:phage terminase large subunit